MGKLGKSLFDATVLSRSNQSLKPPVWFDSDGALFPLAGASVCVFPLFPEAILVCEEMGWIYGIMPYLSPHSAFYLDKSDEKIGHYIAIEKGRRQPSLDDQKPNLGYVCIGDGYFYFNTPASIRQAFN